MNRTLIFAGIGIAAVVGGTLLYMGSGQKPTKEAQHLSARYTTLQSILKEGSTRARSAELKQFSTEASLLIATDQTAISSALPSIGVKKVSKEIMLSEADATTFTKLNDAALNSQFDTVYPNVLARKLDSTVALTEEVDSKTTSVSLKAALARSKATLTDLQNRLSKL